MQHVSASALRPISATAGKAAALAAYASAIASPAGADWQSVAHMLHGALRPSRANSDGTTAVPAWWQDYKLPKNYTRESALVTFRDGEAIRVNIHTAARKGPRVAKAVRMAVAFYRCRTGAESVPAIVQVENLSSGATWDAAECSRLTVELRRAPVTVEPARPVVTVETVARMAREVERRRAGFVREMELELREAADKARARRRADSRHWAAALVGGRRELARMLRALDGAPAPVAAPETLAAVLDAPAFALAPCEAEAEPAGSLDAEPEAVSGGPEAARPGIEAGKPNDFRDSVAPEAGPQPVIPMPEPGPALENHDSGPVSALDVTAGPEAPALDAPHPVVGIQGPVVGIPSADACPVEAIESAAPSPVVGISACPVVGMACRDDCAFREGCELATARPNPVEAIEAAPATETDAEPDLSTDSHPIIAICLSHKGRERLFELVQDGCFPAAKAHGATHGAFHITLQDAQEMGTVSGFRYVGMPRKAYTRRAA